MHWAGFLEVGLYSWVLLQVEIAYFGWVGGLICLYDDYCSSLSLYDFQMRMHGVTKLN